MTPIERPRISLSELDLRRTIEFLEGIGLAVEKTGVPTSFLLGAVAIYNGTLVYDENFSAMGETVADVIGDLLHEGGHLAVLPVEVWPHIDFDVDESLFQLESSEPEANRPMIARATADGSEAAAAAWSYAAALALRLPPEIAFDLAYEDALTGFQERIECQERRHLGIRPLERLGLCENYPNLTVWTRSPLGIVLRGTSVELGAFRAD